MNIKVGLIRNENEKTNPDAMKINETSEIFFSQSIFLLFLKFMDNKTNEQTKKDIETWIDSGSKPLVARIKPG